MTKNLWRAVVTALPFLAAVALLVADGVDVATIDRAFVAWMEAHRRDLLLIALWLSGAWALARLIRHTLTRRLTTRDGTTPPKVLAQLATVVIYTGGLAGVLGSLFGRDLLAALAAMSGIIGLVLGFALRSIILDLFMGLAINMERPFRIGERIAVRVRGTDVVGTVQEISWRCTRVLTTESTVAILPNREISEAVVINEALPSCRNKLTVDVTVEDGVPVDRASRVLEAALQDAAAAGGPVAAPVRVEVKAVTGAGITYCCVFQHDHTKTSSTGLTRDVALRAVLRHLHAAGIRPASERLVNVDGGPQTAATTPLELLGRVPLFAPLTTAERAQLGAASVLRTLPRGEELIRQGTTGDTLFVVVEGFLEALVEDRVVGTIPAGGLIGEMAMLTGEARRATVRTVTEVVAWEISREALAPLLAARPELMQTLSEIAAARHRRISALNAQPGAVPEDDVGAGILAAMGRVFGRLKMAALAQ